MDTLAENKEIDTTFEMFGKTFKYPIFAGPVGAVSQHYSDLYNDNTFNEIYVRACAKSGIAAFTGDGLNEEIMVHATHYIKENNGIGVPTIKPWDKETCFKKLELAKASKAFAIAMDVDAAGLPFLQGRIPPAGRKSVAELKKSLIMPKFLLLLKELCQLKERKKRLMQVLKGLLFPIMEEEF